MERRDWKVCACVLWAGRGGGDCKEGEGSKAEMIYGDM